MFLKEKLDKYATNFNVIKLRTRLPWIIPWHDTQATTIHELSKYIEVYTAGSVYYVPTEYNVLTTVL